MERIYRVVLLGLFVLGFLGVVTSAGHSQEAGGAVVDESPMASLIRDVRLAQEVNDINSGRWNQDVSDAKQDGLARVESFMIPAEAQQPKEIEATANTQTDDSGVERAKSELNVEQN